MNRYYLFECRTNLLIPGDWEWYLKTYDSRRTKDGGQKWNRDSRVGMRVQIYEVPRAINSYSINAVEFTPACGVRYSGKTIPAPDGVRWGIISCFKKSFLTSLGPGVAEKFFHMGELVDRREKVIEEWIPVVCRNHFSLPLTTGTDPDAYAAHLAGDEVYDDDNYILILREDVFERVKACNTKGCKIHQWSFEPQKGQAKVKRL